MRKIIVLLYIVDILVVILLSKVLSLWKIEHDKKGLMEMLDEKLFFAYWIIAIVIFVCLTVVIIKNICSK